MASLFYLETGLMESRNAILAGNWWAVAIRGVLAILFGIAAFAIPGATILALVFIFGAYSFFDGVASIILAAWDAEHHERWGVLLLHGIAGIAFGLVAFLWPGITVLAFVFLVAAWAITWGVIMLIVATNLKISHGRWFLVFAGLLSLVYGVLLCLSPLMGALVVTWWIGAYALVIGATLLVLAFRLAGHKPERMKRTQVSSH
jgi:uncharacterized membrane protein HdeD (DUF308 family)